MQKQHPQQLGSRLEIPLDENLPRLAMTQSPVGPDENNDKFISLYNRVDVEVLNNWAMNTLFMRGSIGHVVQEPNITDDFRQFLQMMYGAN